MKKISILLTSVFIMLVHLTACTQSYDHPESVTYDPASGNYYISNTSAGQILKRDSNASLSVFVDISAGLVFPRGLCISNEVVYVTDLTHVKGFSLGSATQVFDHAISGSSSLNDIVVDDAGQYLFISDNDQNKVYRVDIANSTDSVFIGTGLNKPNGLFYDGPAQRIIIVEFATNNATIKSAQIINPLPVYLQTSTPNMLDGVARDHWGYWYVSSWATNKIYRYHPTFLGTPAELNLAMGIVSGPADIYINTSGNPDILALPSMNNSQVYFFPLVNTGLEESASSLEATISPNPSGKDAKISFNTRNPGKARISLLDSQGRLIGIMAEQWFDSGIHYVDLDSLMIARETGLYWIEITAGGISERLKWVLSK